MGRPGEVEEDVMGGWQTEEDLFLCLAYKKQEGGKIDACGGACFLGYYDGLCETC